MWFRYSLILLELNTIESLNKFLDSIFSILINMFFDPGKNSKKLMLFEDNSSLTKSIELKLLSCIKDNRQKEMYFSKSYSSRLNEKIDKNGIFKYHNFA